MREISLSGTNLTLGTDLYADNTQDVIFLGIHVVLVIPLDFFILLLISIS